MLINIQVRRRLLLLGLHWIIYFGIVLTQEPSPTSSSAIPDPVTTISTRATSAATRPVKDHRKYSAWSRWSPCTHVCEQKRFRSCLLTNEDQCQYGPLHVQTRGCSRGKCSLHSNTAPRSHRHVEDLLQTNTILEEFFYSSWSRWSACYVSDCKQYRTKVCTLYPMCGDRILVQQKQCHVGVCDFGEPEQPRNTPVGTTRPPVITENYYPEQAPERGGRRNSQCGVPILADESGIEMKIFGGRASSAGRWPWQVSLLNVHLENYCAGTLISNWVITAAHCLRRRMYIRLGEHNIYREEETEQLFRPLKIISHPNFNLVTIENDIAMIKLSSSIRWGPYAHPACLPSRSDDDSELLHNSTQCVILGWGKRRPQARYGADVLHEAEVDVISHTRCKDAYYEDHTITPRMLCAGNGRTGRSGDTCEGDSGGPLLCQLGSDTGTPRPWKLFGVTSFGDSCGKKDKYGVYTKVSMYINWINAVIARD